ncbi:hypothetical protein [Ilumatobacter sp.]|uniref:hypothetical protein n=1 Tax=Ilumatobacter sp. TaxID=1967498 RepID=UPI003753B324
MKASEARERSSNRTVSASSLANQVSAARTAAVLVALGAAISALVLAYHTTIDPDGSTSRPFVGQAIAVVASGIGLVAILLFLVAWAEAWRGA